MFAFLYKHLNTLSVLLLLTALTVLTGMQVATPSYAETDDETTQNYCDVYEMNGKQLFEDLLDAAGIGGEEDDQGNMYINWSGLFAGTSEEPKVKDLYLGVYQELKRNPAADALQDTAEQYQYTQTEMCSIMGGNLALLITTSNGSSETPLTTEEGIELYNDIMEEYNENLAKYEWEQKLLLDTYPKEIFSNGRTDDSGFDVLYDLEIIEYILFGDDTISSASDSGDLPGMDEEEESDGGGSDDTDEPEDEEETAEEESEDEEDAESTEETDETIEEDGGGDEEEEDGVDPLECVADEELQTAFEETLEDGEGDEEENDDSSDDDGDSDDDTEGSGGSSGSGTTEEEEGSDDDDGGSSEAVDETAWSSPSMCDSVFCLVIRFLNKPDPEYDTTANCIKCHVDYIVAALDQTVDKTLNPGKVSGNLLEPGTCKRGYTSTKSLSLSFIPVAMPLPTPGPSHLVTDINIADSFVDFVEDTWGPDAAKVFGSNEEQSEKEAATTEDTVRRFYDYQIEESLKNTQTKYPVDTNEELLDEALIQYEAALEEINNSFKYAGTRARLSGAADFYQAMQYEMNQMIFFFSSYQTLIGMSQEVAEELAANLKKIQ